MTRAVGLALVALVGLGAGASAQQTPPPAPGAAPGTATAPAGAGQAQVAAPALPAPPANYTYAPEGRRDPFVSLVSRGVDPRGGTTKRAEGVAGLLTSEMLVKGILLSRGTWIAMVTGPEGKMLTLRAGDRLADGVVRTVTAQAVVVLQEVNDPLSLEKQREVRKLLRGGEEVK